MRMPKKIKKNPRAPQSPALKSALQAHSKCLGAYLSRRVAVSEHPAEQSFGVLFDVVFPDLQKNLLIVAGFFVIFNYCVVVGRTPLVSLSIDDFRYSRQPCWIARLFPIFDRILSI